MTKKNIYIHMKQTPIHPSDFADSMTSRIQTLNPDFHCGGKIRAGFTQYGAAYNDCVDLNSKGETTQIVIPAATGSGKSVSATLYLSQIAQMGMSGLLVVSEVSVAIEAAEDINDLAGEKMAGVYHSISDKNPVHDLWSDIDELPRIAIITHAMFIQRSDTGKDIEALRAYNGKQRDIIIIDERIDLIKCVSFGTNEVADAIRILKRDTRLRGYAQILSSFNKIIFSTKTNVAVRNIDKLRQSFQCLRNDLLTLLNWLNNEHFNLSSCIRRKKWNPDSDKASVKGLLSRIIYVLDGDYTQTVEGSTVVCHRVEDLSGKFGSAVVLDATSQVNPEYEYREANGHDIVHMTRIESRNYSNVTLNVCSFKGPKQSKTAIYTNPRKKNKHIEIIDCYLKVIGPILNPGDKLLVATYKSVEPLFEERNPYKNQVKFIHWGGKDARGSNTYKDFNKAMAIGFYRKPDHSYVASVMAIKPFDQYVTTNGSVMSDANHLKDMLIVDDMIQFFNRVKCRTAIDNIGNCNPVELYCFTGGSKLMDELIRGAITSEMPNTVFKEWEPKGLNDLQQKLSKNEERAERFIRWLRGRIDLYEEIYLSELMQEFDLKHSVVSKAINTDVFNDLLAEEGITMIKAKGRSNPTRFILPKNKI